MIGSDGEFGSELTVGLRRLREQTTRAVPRPAAFAQYTTRAVPRPAAFAQHHRQMAELATRYSQQPASALANSTLPIGVVQTCAFVLLFLVLFIGWILAAAVGPETRSKYMDITELIGFALMLSLLINDRRGRNSDS